MSRTTTGFDALGVLPGIGGFTEGAKGDVGIGGPEAPATAGGAARAGGILGEAERPTRKFLLFGKEGAKVFVKGDGIAGRSRAAVEGAVQVERDLWTGGTKILDPASKPVELPEDFRTFDKEHPRAAESIRRSARVFAATTGAATSTAPR